MKSREYQVIFDKKESYFMRLVRLLLMNGYSYEQAKELVLREPAPTTNKKEKEHVC